MQWQITQNDADMRLDRFIRRELGGMPQSALEKHLRSGRIRVGGRKQKSNYRLQSGDEVSAADMLARSADDRAGAAAKPAEPVSEKARRQAELRLAAIEICRTENWIAYNKPSGVAVQGGSGTTQHIDNWLQMLEGERPKLVHRIDKDTSGLLLVARHDSAARQLTSDFRDHLISKSYLAVVCGNPGASGVIDASLRKWGEAGQQKMHVDEKAGLSARTLFIRLELVGSLSLVALQPVTGRTHQLRAHMAHNGTPILGDGKYGGGHAHHDGFASRLHLHAQFLSLADGTMITAPLSEHMAETLDRLGCSSAVPQTMPSFKKMML